MHTMQQRAKRDALMGLGTVAFMCGDDGVAGENFERASKCCRWEIAACHAGKTMLIVCAESQPKNATLLSAIL